MIDYRDENLVEIGGLPFKFVQDLSPKRDNEGKIIQDMPQSRYNKSATCKLNAHGQGPYCKFSIDSRWMGYSGVYGLFSKNNLLYLGRCVDLSERFNKGYGTISPRNCFVGGQSTNCKINMMVLAQSLKGDRVSLYFYETNDHECIERTILNQLITPYNGSNVRITVPRQSCEAIVNHERTKNVVNTPVGIVADENKCREYWRKMVTIFSADKIEIHTTPKLKSKQPLWFSVSVSGDDIYVGNAVKHSPSTKLSANRKLSYPEFERMYPIYLKRKAGHQVSTEATAASHNQVYWYALMGHCDL